MTERAKAGREGDEAEDLPQGRPPSFIRFRSADPVDGCALAIAEAADAKRFRDALEDDHLDLTVNLLHLQLILDGAASILRVHTQELAEVRSKLERVIEHADDPKVAPLLCPGSALAAYLRGIYLWCNGVIDALEEACDATHAYRDSGSVRWRLVESSHFHFGGLSARIRGEVRGLSIEAPVEELLWSAAWMHDSMARSLER